MSELLPNALKEKMDALDVPGAVIAFDPEEAEAMGLQGEGESDAAWAEALSSSLPDPEDSPGHKPTE